MSMSDTLGDLLTRIRNASGAGHEKVDVPTSRVKAEVVRILKEEGYIRTFRAIEDKKQGSLRIYFKRGEERDRPFSSLKRVSRPGLRVYVRKDQVPRVLGGLGTAVISTSSGIMTDRDARKKGLGGEHLFNIW